MKVSCTQEALARGLGIVGRAVAARSPLPITSNVLVATDKDRLKLTATNLEITLSCWVQARIEATIGGLDADDFPPAPVVKDGVSVKLKPKELRQAIAQTVFAAATDDS